MEKFKLGDGYSPDGQDGDGEIPVSGRELAAYVRDMLLSLRRCVGAPYFTDLREKLRAAEQEAEAIAAARKKPDAKRQG